MGAFLDYVQRGQIEGINRAMLDEAYQVLAYSQDPRKDRIQVCLKELTLHLLEDPDRRNNVEFKKLAKDVVDLTNQCKALKQNYQNLASSNKELEEKVKAQQKTIDDLSQQLVAERARTRHYQLKEVNEYVASLDSLHTKNGIFYSIFMPVTVFVVRQLSEEQRALSAKANRWRNVADLISNKKLMKHDAIMQVF